MSAQAPQELQRRYQQLRQRLSAGQLNQQQFLSEVDRLQVRDQRGTWWAVEPQSGAFLVHDGVGWVPARPAPAGRHRAPGRSRWSLFVAVGMPLVTAAIWFLWGAMHPVGEMGIDCLTPMILAGVPISLLLFEKRLDPLLLPLQPYVKRFPKAVRLGMAFALPVVLGLVLSSVTHGGFGALRLTLVVSMLGAYALLHEPEVRYAMA